MSRLRQCNNIHPGERCTVFMETGIAAHLARRAKLPDIASGLCYAVVKNYLNRVVGEKKIGNRIFFQGGVAYNQGVVNAFRALLGKDIHVPPFFSVTGAYGVALLAKEEMASGKTGFKGFDVEQKEIVIERQKGSEPKTGQRKGFNKQIEELIFAGYDGSRDDKKKTVGIPRALFTYGTFPMFYTFFKELGFNVLLSDPTNEETIKRGQEYSLDETCYPVKLINGHVAELVRKNVDSIFFPDLYTVDHPGSQSSRASVDSGRKHTLTNEYLSVTALFSKYSAAENVTATARPFSFRRRRARKSTDRRIVSCERNGMQRDIRMRISSPRSSKMRCASPGSMRGPSAWVCRRETLSDSHIHATGRSI